LIKRVKKQSFKALTKSSPFKIAACIILILSLYVFLPVYLLAARGLLSLRQLLIFYLACATLAFYLIRRSLDQRYQLEYKTQTLQEKFNILKEQNRQGTKNNLAWEAKIKRYQGLRSVIEEVSQNLDLKSMADSLTSLAFSLIANNKGTTILYVVDNQTQKLSLFKAKKEQGNLVIKAKEGDIFDLWVLRHNSPLLVEDTKKDFRFDLEKLKTQDSRPLSSLVSSALISESRFLGILRLDSPKKQFFSQDDLRFLVSLCDLGAVALENSQLYQKTHDLAIRDSLTSLYTKGYFLDRLREECRRGMRHKESISLFMLDIDFFKNFNDKFGHTAGDIVLKNLSNMITEFLNELAPLKFVVSRFGGEEFCILLLGIDKKVAKRIAVQLRERIEGLRLVLRRQETKLTVSIGVATFPVDAIDEHELIQKADRAMYIAKQKGRNKVCCI